MNDLPIVVIGAGPTGLAAAAQIRSRGLTALVLEAGDYAGTSVREWSHVRLFSAWSELIEPEADRLLSTNGWTRPDPDGYPTGMDWARDYLQPLADALGSEVRYGARVVGVTRRGRDLVVDSGRDAAPFVVHIATEQGSTRVEARAVIDASGTWSTPNPLGGDGLAAEGEPCAQDRIVYRVPDLTDPATRTRYAGKHVVLAGSGHSAMTALLALAGLASEEPDTRVSWIVRRGSTADAFGGGENDQLAARGALGQRAQAATSAGHVTTITGFRTVSATSSEDGTLRLTSCDGQQLDSVDELVVVTGFRPDHSMLSEIRLDLDPVLQAPRVLAPLIDPNVHSCGTVYPHGAKELAQPESGFYLVGMKSYGRAPSFLALTGYEQVRSVVAEIAGDHEAAARVELVLPESGVCGGAGLFDEAESPGSSGCCGGPSDVQLISLGGTQAK